jgi:hypothetical protein
MKNLQHYKQQKKERTHLNSCKRATENCNAAMFDELKRRMQPHYAASQERWDGMLKSLRVRAGIAHDYRLHNPRIASLMAATARIIGEMPEAMLDNIIHSSRMRIPGI